MVNRYSVEEIQSMLDRLPSAAAVAAELGVSRQFVHEFIKRHNISYDAKKKRKEASEAKYAERNKAIIDSYKSGSSKLSLAAEFGLTRASINRILDKHGVESRKESACIERNRAILEMKLNGKKPSEIAESFGLSRQYVANIIWRSSKKG